jgi:translation initiation factor 3 subunit D
MRGDIDAVTAESQDDVKLINIRTLNEYWPIDQNTNQFANNYIDWRKKLQAQRGAVMITEMRNNQWKMARWALEACLSDVDALKIGFITRLNLKDPAKGHSLLGVHSVKPADFATQLNLNMNQCWGVVKYWTEIFLGQDDGTYVIYKDPNMPKIRLYKLPAQASPTLNHVEEEED